MERPDKTMYFLNIALSVAKRSTCIRRKFGAVIVKDDTIVGTGYNGTARGVVNCYNVGCIKDILNAPSGKSYDYCPAVHAEENAIINSNRTDRIGATLFVAGIDNEGELTVALPCKRCRRKIVNSQIEKVIILDNNGTPLTFKVNDYIKEDTNWYIGELENKRSSDCE